MSELINIIRSADPSVKNKSLDEFCKYASLEELLIESDELELYRKEESNLYYKVRALFFLYAIHRFYIPEQIGIGTEGLIPMRVTAPTAPCCPSACRSIRSAEGAGSSRTRGPRTGSR